MHRWARLYECRSSPPVLKGELVNENNREEPVCLKYSEGLVDVNVGARPPVLKGELVRVSSWARLYERRSSAACVEGRARQSEQLGSWHCGETPRVRERFV